MSNGIAKVHYGKLNEIIKLLAFLAKLIRYEIIELTRSKIAHYLEFTTGMWTSNLLNNDLCCPVRMMERLM